MSASVSNKGPNGQKIEFMSFIVDVAEQMDLDVTTMEAPSTASGSVLQAFTLPQKELRILGMWVTFTERMRQ